SGAVEQDADMVILLHRPDMHDPESPRAGEADLIVDKHRGGARGLTDDEPEQDLDTAVRFHQQRTVDNLIELRTLAPDIPWMP
ncbi:hypothetical protein KBZ21_40170, partial [Streptomyces sp. A73]|nr:hypothetical protein [Streptomyces sp. A73]